MAQVLDMLQAFFEEHKILAYHDSYWSHLYIETPAGKIQIEAFDAVVSGYICISIWLDRRYPKDVQELSLYDPECFPKMLEYVRKYS
jgi:hypothetical protein